MKKIAKILILAATAFFAAEMSADAQVLKNLLKKATSSSTTTTTTASEATNNGEAAGAALKSLYTQYKTDGKLDVANLNNILNLTTLANNIKGLKGISNKSSFYKEFAAGLINGSDELVNSKNSTAVMNGLTNIVNEVDLSSVASTAENAASTSVSSATSAATSALTGLLSNASSSVESTLGNTSELTSSVSSILNLFK